MKTDLLASRHIGINEEDTAVMLRKIGVDSLDELINIIVDAVGFYLYIIKGIPFKAGLYGL